MRAAGLLAALAIATSGCALMEPTTSTSIDPVRLQGAVVQRTSFEGPSSPGAPGPDATVRGGARRSDDAAQPAEAGNKSPRSKSNPGTEKEQRTRKGVFWAGIALVAIGGATLLASGIGGRVTQGQLNQGYQDENLSHARENELRDRGYAFNVVAATSGAVMIAGTGMAAISFGIDYSRCGSIAKRKKRKDCK